MSTLRSADLTRMSAPERSAAIAHFAAGVHEPNPTLRKNIADRVRVFEHRYALTSEEMKREVATGHREETDEIVEWLFLLEARDCHVAG